MRHYDQLDFFLDPENFSDSIECARSVRMLLVVFNNLRVRNAFHSILRRRNARKEFGHSEGKGHEHLLIIVTVPLSFFVNYKLFFTCNKRL